MWETIKKDPLIKTIVVALLGILAFGFAFRIMFGSGNGAMEGEMMGMNSGYPLGNTLEVIIALLIKITFIALLIGVIVWILRAIQTSAGKNQTDRFAWVKNDPVIKNAIIIIGIITAFVFLIYVVRFHSYTEYGENESMIRNSSWVLLNMSYGFQSLIVMLIKLLIIFFVFGLGYGLFMYRKENYKSLTESNGNSETTNNNITICPDCKAPLKEGWNCCPYCGLDKGIES